MSAEKWTKIIVCVGSSCHLKGSKHVAEALRTAIETHHLLNRIDFCGAFCLGHCVEGVCVMVDDALFSVQPGDEEAFFAQHVLPLFEKARGEEVDG